MCIEVSIRMRYWLTLCKKRKLKHGTRETGTTQGSTTTDYSTYIVLAPCILWCGCRSAIDGGAPATELLDPARSGYDKSFIA